MTTTEPERDTIQLYETIWWNRGFVSYIGGRRIVVDDWVEVRVPSNWRELLDAEAKRTPVFDPTSRKVLP